MLDTLGGVNEKAAMTNAPQTKKITKGVLVLLLAAAGAGILAVSCAWNPNVRPLGGSQPEFIISFGDTPTSDVNHRVHLANSKAFLKALKSPPVAWSTLMERDTKDGQEYPIPPNASNVPVEPATSGSLTIARSADSVRALTHVTQKVGLNDLTQLQKVLAAVGPQ